MDEDSHDDDEGAPETPRPAAAGDEKFDPRPLIALIALFAVAVAVALLMN